MALSDLLQGCSNKPDTVMMWETSCKDKMIEFKTTWESFCERVSANPYDILYVRVLIEYYYVI